MTEVFFSSFDITIVSVLIKVIKKRRTDSKFSGEGTGTPHMIYQGERCREEMNVHNQDPFEMLDHVKMNNTLETPVSTLKGLFRDSKDVDLRFKKEELRKAEERLRVVFIVFYQKLHHLRLYR